jgi:hypothetical protein
MLLCFVDESGSPPPPGKADRRRYFIIAGVIMHESQWHGVAEEVRQLKNKKEYSVDGEIKWRYFGRENTDKDNSVSHLDQAQKDKFRESLFEIITKRKSIKIIACAADALAAYKTTYVNTQDDLYHYAYKPVSERFQYHLQDISRSVGDKQLGIVIADHRGKKQDETFRKRHHKLVDDESAFTSKYENYIETIFLTPSHLSIGIQLADMVAGAVGRAMNSRDLRFAKMIKPAFRARPNGKIDGFGFVRFPCNGWGKPSGGGQAP